MPKTTVVYEGSEIEVEIGDDFVPKAELEANYLHRDQVRETYVLKAEMQRRLHNTVKRSTAAQDKDVIAAVLAENTNGFDVEQAKREWRKAELDPVVGEIQSLRSSVLKGQMIAAASKYFNDPQGLFAGAFENRFAWDSDHNAFAERNGDGFMPSINPTADMPYRGVDEFFEALSKDEAYKPYLKQPTKNQASGYKGSSKVPSQAKRSSMTDVQKVQFIKDHGPEAYQQLAD